MFKKIYAWIPPRFVPQNVSLTLSCTSPIFSRFRPSSDVISIAAVMAGREGAGHRKGDVEK